MQIDSNQLNANNGPRLCGSASCGSRGTNECVNQASNSATNSGDYLQIEGAFSFDTGTAVAGNTGTRGGGGRRKII